MVLAGQTEIALGTEFVVEVLEGRGKGTVAILTGREKPHRGTLSYEVQQQTVLTWYPGNPEASQQILGPREGPTTISGVWSDRYLGAGRSAELAAFFRDLCREGAAVRVVWTTNVRTGVVRRAKTTPGVPTGGAGDLAWEVEFEWRSSADTRRAPSAEEAAGDFRDDVSASAEELESFYSTLDEALSRLLGSDADRFSDEAYRAASGAAVRSPFAGTRIELDLLKRSVVELEELGRAIGEDGPPAVSQVERVLAAAANVAALAGSIGDVFADLFHADVSGDDSLPGVVSVALARADAFDAESEAIVRAVELGWRADELARPDAIAVVPAVSGSDLRRIAIAHYGDADLWTEIAAANGLEDSVVPDDVFEIVVPRVGGRAVGEGR